jgi:hypothetical protein
MTIENNNDSHQKRLYNLHHRIAREIPLWGWLAAIAYMILVGNLLPSNYKLWALSIGWFLFGAMCLFNYSSCGRYHCKITGPAFIGIGAISVLDTVGIINLQNWIIGMLLPCVALIIGFGLEYRYRSTVGTCYVVDS